MAADPSSPEPITLAPVTPANWRYVAGLRVAPDQRAFVAEPAYYLALCCYSEVGWSPLAICAGAAVVGFLMWAVDADDGACWLGGILVDAEHQGKGIGTAAVRGTIELLGREHGHRDFALSYLPENTRAKDVYRRLGFVETGEREDDEVVARLRPSTTP